MRLAEFLRVMSDLSAEGMAEAASNIRRLAPEEFAISRHEAADYVEVAREFPRRPPLSRPRKEHKTG